MTAKEAKIAIYGAGAMGTVLGAFLTMGGLEVTLVTRNTEHMRGLNERGAQIDCVADGDTLRVPVRACLPAEMGENYDVVFLMTKQKNNAEIVDFLLPKLSADGIICTTQNGLPERLLAQKLGDSRTYGGVASFGAELFGGGMVALTSKKEAMRVQVGGYENDGSKTALLADILSYAGAAAGNPTFAQPTENLAGARWSKLAVNAAFSGLSVVTGLTFGEIAKKRKARKVALGVLRECIAVADGLGITLEKMQGHDMKKFLCGRGVFSKTIAYLALPIVMRKHKKLKSGMLKDVENGKRCEIDYVNGVVCELGKSAGVETPLCDTIVELTHGVENGLYEISEKNLAFIG